MAVLRPFFSYYGGKWRAAELYPEPAHDRIIEPFAGGAGYSLRFPDRRVELCDIDPYVAGVWHYLIDVSESEILSLPTRFDHVDNLLVAEEARWLIGFWLNKAASAPRKQPGKWMRSGIDPTQYWGENIRSRIAGQLEAIRHWKISQASYESLLDAEATWFIDPPYEGPPGRRYRFDRVDYGHLGEWCQGRRGQVIVCERDGATWLPFQSLATIQTTAGKHGKKVSHEVLWTNVRTAEAVA